MELKELIHKLEKARTKDDLEALGIKHLGIDVDKRKTKEILRAELMGEAESRLASEATGDEPAPAPEPTQTEAQDAQEPSVAPAADDTKKSAYPGKMARNKRTGRTMPWTAAMAKMSHMEQV